LFERSLKSLTESKRYYTPYVTFGKGRKGDGDARHGGQPRDGSRMLRVLRNGVTWGLMA
jgi:hypothetical protein